MQLKLSKVYLYLLLSGVSIILALTVVLKIPAWHSNIRGYVGAIFLVGAFILLALASDKLRLAIKKEKKLGGFIKVRKRDRIIPLK